MEPRVGLKYRWILSLAAALWILFGTASSGWTAEEDPSWSQWRGPDGLGISTDRNLPEVWDTNGTGIKWKTKIPGTGHSSPILKNGNVYITTAYNDRRAATAHLMVKIAMALAIVVFIGGSVARLLGLFIGKGATTKIERQIPLHALFSSTLAGFVSVAFLILVFLIFVWPDQYDATVGTFLQKHFGYKDKDDIDHLFYVATGVHVALWLNTGAIALLGLAVSLHWVRAHSIWRPVGAAIFAALAAAFVAYTPADLWKHPLSLSVRWPWVLPSSILAMWYLLGYVRIEFRPQPATNPKNTKTRRIKALGSLNDVVLRWRHPRMFWPGRALPLLLFASLVLIAATVFLPVNLLLPEIGLQRAVLAIDFDTGQVLWHRPVFVAPAERKHKDSSYATPTPATNGQHVVASFGPAVVCLDVEGRVIWEAWDQKYTENTRYGAASSVLIYQDMAIVLQEHEEKAKRQTWMAAFDIPTGDIRWNVSPRNLKWAYTTPLIYDDGGGVQLITASYQNVAGFDINSGHLFWQHKIVLDQLVASMVRIDSSFYLGGGTWGPEKLIAMKLNGSGSQTTVEEVWSASEDTPGCASPVAYKGMIFTVSDKGIMSAYDAKSGRLHWRENLKGRFLASLVAGDGKIYACSTKGRVMVIAAEPQFRIISQNQLEGECRASPAIQNAHLLIRTDEYLYCIGQ